MGQHEGSGPHVMQTGATVTACKETAPPLVPMSRLLDCGTSAATRGSPAHDPTVPIEHNDHGSVSRGGRRDGRYGQKWAGSNCSSRQAEAAVKSPAGSRPLLKRQESPLPRHEDDVPVFHSLNGSCTRNGRPANRPSRRINSSAGQATPFGRRGGRHFHLHHDDRVKKGAPRHLNSYPFPLPISLSYYRDRERGYFEKDPSRRRKRAPEPSY
jgi:hypothetical protein